MKKYAYILLACLCYLTVGCASGGISSLGLSGSSLGGTAPNAAQEIARQIDNQMLQNARLTANDLSHLTNDEVAAKQIQFRNGITVMTTVPVNINNFDLTCALARQMSEEVSRWLMTAGYQVQEIRKGDELRFQERTGEMLLTRDTSQLASLVGASTAVMTGTYVISPDQVRFSIRLVSTPSNAVLGMGVGTVPITPDVPPLLVENTGNQRVEPSVYTSL